MSTNIRSVKIGEDERGGWSSERPRKEGEKERPRSVAVRGKVIEASPVLDYRPGSLVVVVSPTGMTSEFITRVVEDEGAVLDLAKIKRLLKGRVADAKLDATAEALFEKTLKMRLSQRKSVVVGVDDLDGSARERLVRLAAGTRAGRHLILLDASRDNISDSSVIEELNTLRGQLLDNKLGDEGFTTSLRLGGSSAAKVKKVIFGSEE